MDLSDRLKRLCTGRTSVQDGRNRIEEWNRWRKDDRAKIQLRDADLSGLDLSAVDFIGAGFTNVNFAHAELQWSDFLRAQVKESNFQETSLPHANADSATFTNVDFAGATLLGTSFLGAELAAVNFSGADLRDIRLKYASLIDVDMTGADLQAAEFTDSRLERVNFTGAKFGETVFATTTLVNVTGLEAVKHHSPSCVGIDTFFGSRGLPELFLRGAGIPDEFIAYAASLLGKPIDYYSCFISYSEHDDMFVSRLHADLQARNIRTWFAPQDLRIGDKFRSRIDESIRLHDKLVVILSADSIESTWVEKEVETAFARERKEKREILFPIRIDDAVFGTHQAWVADIVNTRHIGNFCAWKTHDDYRVSFDRLVRDLKKDGVIWMK